MILSKFSVIGSAVTSVCMALYSAATYTYYATMPAPIEGFATVSEELMPGETKVIYWQIWKRVNCPGTAVRVWRGENGFEQRGAIRPTTLPVTEGFQPFAVETTIPLHAPPGYLRLNVEGWYDCPGSKKLGFDLGPVIITVKDPNGIKAGPEG